MNILVFLLFFGKYLKLVIEAIFNRHNSLFIRLLKQSSFGLCLLSNPSMLSIKDKFAFFQI